IDAFRSTLEEASLADMLLVIVDSSDAYRMSQYRQVLKVLEEIGAEKIPRLVVLNKIDRVKDDPVALSDLSFQFPDSIRVSAATGEGFEELTALMAENLLGLPGDYIVPLDRPDLVEIVRKNGTIEKEEWLDDGVHLSARIPGRVDENGNCSTKTLSLLKPYQL
ncbi:MAG: GTPase HflX, partial [Treponema sp.]|nr:GTPase HflX [Treponema sp.]